MPKASTKQFTIDCLLRFCTGKRVVRWLMVVFGFLVGILILIRMFGFLPSWSSKPTAVEFAEVQVTDMPEYLEASGILVANRAQILTARVSGRIKKIYFNPGDHIDKGDPVLLLDDSEQKNELDQLQQEYTTINQKLKEFSRLGKMRGVPEAEIKELQSRSFSLRLALQKQVLAIKQFTLYAPFDGILDDFSIREGDFASSGQGLINISEKSVLRVKYALPDFELPRVHLDQEINIMLPFYPDQLFVGDVDKIESGINSLQGQLLIEAKVYNSQSLLAPGMQVNLKQIVADNKSALTIPSSALIQASNGDFVYRVQGDRAVVVPIKTGSRSKNSIVVSEGLRAGDKVVNLQAQWLPDGTPVKELVHDPLERLKKKAEERAQLEALEEAQKRPAADQVAPVLAPEEEVGPVEPEGAVPEGEGGEPVADPASESGDSEQ